MSSGTVAVAINDSPQTGKTGTISSGFWSIADVAKPNSSDVITVWVDSAADADESTAVTEYDGSGNITLLVLNRHILSIGNPAHQNITVTDLGHYDNDDDGNIMHSANSGTLKADDDNAYSDEKIDIISGNTLTIGGGETLITHDMAIDGVLTSSGASAYDISGSWDNNNTFTMGTSTVNFNSVSTGETIDAGGTGTGKDFYDATFNNGSGGWTIGTSDMKVSHNLTITNVNDWTLESGRTLEVDGTYYITDAETASTTWTGSSFYLNGTPQTIGSKTQSAETYGTLRVGADTDVRMWNSSASSYSVDLAGSLYSMDHANVNGDLYIWGAYNVPGNDYWSYARDFDNTDLSGGSERQVAVRIDPAATITVGSGANLSSVGSSSANRTSASRQGSSGGYGLIVDGGTINFQYTDFDYLDGNNGLDIRTGSAVTSLDYCKFNNLMETAGSDDAFITVASSVIGNGSKNKTFLGVQFDNAENNAEFNVNRTGSDDSGYWEFNASAGVFSGEDYDGDDGVNEADPGMLRWVSVATPGGRNMFEGSIIFDGASTFQ
jgi:hypothetical protein